MPNTFLREAPFVRLVFPVVAGISLYHFSPKWHTYVWLGLIPIASLFCVSIYTLPTRYKIRFKGLTGLIINVLLLTFGYTRSYTYYDSNHPDHIQKDTEGKMVVEVIEQPVLKGKFYKAVTRIRQQGSKFTQGRIMGYFEISEKPPCYGDLITVTGKILPIRGPANPFEFDYRRYMRNQNIDYQLFVYYKDWEIIASDYGNALVAFSIDVQTKLKRIFERHFQADEYVAILKALILGDKSAIDTDLKRTFTATGTMHVLAVSGLHVGIVLLFAKGLLVLLFKGKLKIVATAGGLVVIWCFALLTGFSPSVCRACFMFSVLAIGIEMNRSTNVYNSIAFAAFFLLVINPISLFNVGFQFSFLAVTGIVTLQKPIRALITTSSFFWSKIADLTAVSVAAQLATLPLGLFYFGQFPLLFMISNLLVIPAVTMVLYGSIVFIVFCKIPLVANLLSTLIEAYLWFIVTVTKAIEKISFAVIEKVWLSTIDVIVLTALVLGVGMLLSGIRKAALYTCLIAGIMLFTSQAIHRYRNIKTVELIRFDLGKKTLTALRKGRVVIPVSDVNVTESDWEFHCNPYLIACGVDGLDLEISQSPKTTKAVKINNTSYVLNQKTGWLVTGQMEKAPAESKFKKKRLN